MEENIRWKQRFNHFEKAFNLLKSVFEDRKIEELLEYNGSLNNVDISPRNIFKEAYSAKIIKNEDIFIDMMLSRNLFSHTYDFIKFEEIFKRIENDYLKVLYELYNFFLERINS